MPKASFEDVFLKKVPVDGQPIGNVTLMQNLKWNEDKYWNVRDKLLETGKIAIGKGKGGSVYRIKDVKKATKSKVKSDYSSESSLYEPFRNEIEKEYTKALRIKFFVCQKTAHKGSKKTGLWTRPDITLISIEKYPFIPNKIMDIITFEIKHFKGFNILSVFEAAAHTRFASQSYCAVYLPEKWLNFQNEIDRDRIISECKRFGVGLLAFSDPKDFKTYDFIIEPDRVSPDPEEQDKFIREQISTENQRKLQQFF